MNSISGPGRPFHGTMIFKELPGLKSYSGEPPEIIIQGGSRASSVYGKPRQVKELSVEHANAPRHLTVQLSNQVGQERRPDVMNDLSLNLARFLDNGETSAAQSVTQYRYTTLNEQTSPIDPAKFKVDHNDPESELRLSLKTKSGDTLTFIIRRESGYGHDGVEAGIGFQTLSVEFQLDGKLSQKEQDELGGLAAGLNRLANDYFSGEGASLADLGLANISIVSELSLSMKDGKMPGLELTLTENDRSRNIELNYLGNHAELSMDKVALIGNSEGDRRQAALAHYRQMLSEGVDRAEGGKDQKALLLDAFDMLHGPVEETLGQHELSPAESMMVTGLPDFSIHFEGRTVMQNTHPGRQDQAERFSLTLAQETRFKQDGVFDRRVDQRQLWELDASYFKPLDHWDFVDFQNQNYQYYELSERAEIRTLSGLDDGEVYGVQSRTFESRFDAQEYRLGELVDWTTRTRDLSEVRDFTTRLRNLDDQLNKVKLEELLLDPAELSSQAEVEVIDQDESAIPKVTVPGSSDH